MPVTKWVKTMPKKFIKMSKHDAIVTMYQFMLDVMYDPNGFSTDICFDGNKTNAGRLVSAMKIVLDDVTKVKNIGSEEES